MDEEWIEIRSNSGDRLPDLCEACGHAFGAHLLHAATDDPTQGGTMSCPECDCFGTWGVEDDHTKEMMRSFPEIWLEEEYDGSTIPEQER